MRKPPHKPERSEIVITASIEEPCMLQLLVETLAESNPDLGYGLKQVQPGWTAIETSSIEARISGSVNLSGKSDIRMPFVTCFVFTCTKETIGKHELKWSNSLS